ncbi:MAG: hypothetical protein RMJ56_01485 [Gemmataceae bacterium]|nr:hypothetical protein [Gemmata sp.]MDW8196254.1 hypothetical protein [Gemmataceae bacterium]
MSASDDESGWPLPGHFRMVVAAELAAAGYSIIAWDEHGVALRSVSGDEQYIGLTNLYRRARPVPPDEWPALVREFLNRLTRVQTHDIPTDLTTVADRLRPRLGRPFDRQQAHPWGMPLAGTPLEITLVIDFPHTMAYITADMLARSRQRGEDLLDIALHNLRNITPPDYLERVSDELDISVGSLGDGYDAARALIIEALLPDTPAGHWLVIPSRDELAVWPVSLAGLGRIHILKMFAEENFREHAYPIANDVFWVWRGRWYPFGVTLRGNDVVIDAPEPFGEALAALR